MGERLRRETCPGSVRRHALHLQRAGLRVWQSSMIRDQFWFGAAWLSLWLNKGAWRVYSFSERLRIACLNIWMHP